MTATILFRCVCSPFPAPGAGAVSRADITPSVMARLAMLAERLEGNQVGCPVLERRQDSEKAKHGRAEADRRP